MHPLYVSATIQDSGKTAITLGLIQLLKARGLDPGYIKPVGQNYVAYQGHNIDEDAVLVRDALDFSRDEPQHMSPIAIERGFTRKFIQNPDVSVLEKRIVQAQRILEKQHPMMLVEGTGHAGVGSCFGLSNARVAQITGSKAIIVTTGGIGRPIDEIALSLAVFRHHNIDVLGVVLNKVLPAKMEQVRSTVAKGLRLVGTELLGAMPYESIMSIYNLRQVAEQFDYEVVAGAENIRNEIHNIVVAAMEPQNALKYMKPHSLIIAPGDRTDIILLAMTLAGSVEHHDTLRTGGLVLTGGLKPEKTILQLLKKSSIPVLSTDEDTYTVAARMKDLAFKIQTSDTEKIEETRRLVEQYVDVDGILSKLA